MGDWLLPAALGAFLAIAWFLVGGGANVTIIDDWVYGWSVEHLLQTRRLEILPFSAVYPLAQIAWGTLFAAPAGFSFAALRASTVALTVLGGWALYLTLRELGCRRDTSALGAFALTLDPAYFLFTYSFNTDVPFADVSAIAVYWYVSGVRRGEVRRLWAGAAFSVLAFLIRPLGIVLPLVAVPALLWRRPPDWIRRLFPLVSALALMAVLRVAIRSALGPLDWEAIRQEQIRWWFTISYRTYLKWTLTTILVSVFPFAPLFLASLVRRRHAMIAVAVAILLVVPLRYVYGAVPTPLPDWQTWSLQDMGSARSLVAGDLGSSAWSARAMPWVNAIGLVNVAAFVVVCAAAVMLRRPRQGPSTRLRAGPSTSLRPSPSTSLRASRPLSVVMTLALLNGVLIHVLWLYNDRYYLALAPQLAVLGALAIDEHAAARWIASALLVVWGAIAISGTRDVLGFAEASTIATRELEASGVAAADIDAGYPLNGWRLYAHPEHLPPGVDRRYEVPFVTGDNGQVPYALMSHPTPDVDVVRIVPLPDATWQASRELYVVKRR